jgi:signal transduction histidine kinase
VKAVAAKARRSFEREYYDAVRRYLKKADESSLESAYEVGRRALEQGVGVVEIAALHDEALRRQLRSATSPEELPRTAQRLGQFLIESLSPYEMTHRGYRDVQNALHRLNETLETEARRIAHALHDEAGQLLVTVHLALEKLVQSLPPGFETQVQEVRARLGDVEKELRRLSHELRPPMLDDLGLIPALDFMAQGISKRSGLEISVEGWVPKRLPPLAEMVLYRAVQESLTNATKHAQAGRVTIGLQQQRRARSNWLVCSVKDDGVGFQVAPGADGARRGLGLLGMRERIHALGGCLDINTGPGMGTELVISLPCPDTRSAG